MSRRPRIEQAGFHHLINRGVAKTNIFLKPQDYEKFLQIVLEAKERYDFIVHSLCLMSNHYHLLLETKQENLSLIARQINSKYAQYFNKEYKRVGPLWQGRFKNYYVYDESYLYVLFRYVERNPIKAKITDVIGKYLWNSSTFLLLGIKKELMNGSLLYNQNIFELLDNDLTTEDMQKLEKLQKTSYTKQNNVIKREKKKSLDSYFVDIDNIIQRNKEIRKAVIDGYKQSEIAEFLKISRTTIYKVIR